MDDTQAMQGGDPSGEADADRPPLLQANRRAAYKARLQKLALVERHHGVEAGLAPGRQLQDLRHPRTVHMRPDPRLAHEPGVMGGDRGDLSFRELERRLAASTSSTAPNSRLYRPSEMSALSANPFTVSPATGVAISGNCMIAPPTSAEAAVGSATTSMTNAVQLSALPRRARPPPKRAQCRPAPNAGAAGFGDGVVGQHPVHAVATQQETVVQSHRLGGIVEARVRFGAERAREHPRVARSTFPGVILGDDRSGGRAPSR